MNVKEVEGALVGLKFVVSVAAASPELMAYITANVEKTRWAVDYLEKMQELYVTNVAAEDHYLPYGLFFDDLKGASEAFYQLF